MGKVKEKMQAHEDGNLHRTAHIWIINNKNYYYKKEVLVKNHIQTAGTFQQRDI